MSHSSQKITTPAAGSKHKQKPVPLLSAEQAKKISDYCFAGYRASVQRPAT